MRKKIILAALAAATLMMSSCEVLTQLGKELQSVANLANCQYNLKNVSNVSVAGVNVKNITNGNISAGDVLKLSSALLAKKVPLTMDVNIGVTNPTANPATLSTMDWIMEIEGTEFANGTTTKSFNITPNAQSTVPLSVSTDIYSMFSGNGIESLKSFVNSFTSDGTSSKVALKIKPSLNVGGVVIPSPNFIKLEKEISGSSLNGNSNNSTSTSTSTNTNNNNNSGSGSGVKPSIPGKKKF